MATQPTMNTLEDVYLGIFLFAQSQPRFNATHADLAVAEIEATRAGNSVLARFKRHLRRHMEAEYGCMSLDDLVELGISK